MNDDRTNSGDETGASRGRKLELERLADLAAAGAERAATAFGQLAGREIRSETPALLDGLSAVRLLAPLDASDAGEPRRASAPDWCTGVFFEFEGCVEAIVGILFPGRSSEALVRRIVGVEAGEVAAPLIESALMEVGNILASHVASAIADRLSERLLPSIPSLAMTHADQAWLEWVESRGMADGPCVLCVLRDEGGELEGRLVLVPSAVERPRSDAIDPVSS